MSMCYQTSANQTIKSVLVSYKQMKIAFYREIILTMNPGLIRTIQLFK